MKQDDARGGGGESGDAGGTAVGPFDMYTSPLASRNASVEMLSVWSARRKFDTWRRIWLAIASAQHDVTRGWGRPLVSAGQVAELGAVVERGISGAEIERASALERELRHDVMSHVHALGEACPVARGIIHLGCTSQDVVCNADWVVQAQAAGLISVKLARVIVALGDFAMAHRGTPALGFTHYQGAQPVTVGRRAAQWAHDLDLARRRFCAGVLWARPRGVKGATGTQASFLSLFDGDRGALAGFEGRVTAWLWSIAEPSLLRVAGLRSAGEAGGPADTLGYAARAGGGGEALALSGQTYPRVLDAFVLADLAAIASVVHKIATDIRLLCNLKELDEPAESGQIGSSAMPYKRNPMRCERACGLSRFVMNLVGNAYDTAGTQWLERTLDDSSNRRLSLPEAYLAVDGALELMHNVASGLVVHGAMVRKNLMAELPFLATENILMEAVRAGGDRQDLHERIRLHAREAGQRVKRDGLENDLIERLRGDPAFAPVHHRLTEAGLLDPTAYTGRAEEQTERFVREAVGPLRAFVGAGGLAGASGPRV